MTALAPLPPGAEFVAARCASGTIRVWNLHSASGGPPVFERAGPAVTDAEQWSKVNFALSSNGWLAVGNPDGSVLLQPLRTAEEPRFLPGSGEVLALVFSPDAKALAVARSKSPAVEVLPWMAGRRTVASTQSKSSAWPGAMMGNGWRQAEWMAGSRSGSGRRNGRRCWAIPERRSRNWCFRIRAVISRPPGSTTRFGSGMWTPGVEEIRLTGYGVEPVLRFAPDDRRLVATDFGLHAVLLEVVLPSLCRSLRQVLPDDFTGLAGTLDFPPDDRLLVAASFGGWQLRDAASGKLLRTGQSASGWSASFTRDGRSLLLARRKVGLERCLLASDSASEMLLAEKGQTLSGCTPDGRVAALTSRVADEIRLVALDAKTTSTVLARQGGVWDVQFSPDGRLAVATSGAQAIGGSSGRPANPTVYEVPGGRRVTELEIGASGMAVFSPDGRFVAASGQRGCRLWQTKDWTPGPLLPAEVQADGTFLTWSPDGAFLAVCVGERVHLFSTQDFSTLLVLEAPLLPASGVRLRFDHAERRLVLQSVEGALQIWDLEASSKELQRSPLAW